MREPREFCDDPVEAMRDVMETPAGRRLLHYILGETKVYHQGFAGNSSTFFQEGERNVGLKLIALMDQVDPTLYPMLLLDAAKHALTENSIVNASDSNGKYDERQD